MRRIFVIVVILCAVGAITPAFVAQNTPPKQQAESKSHNGDSQNNKADIPAASQAKNGEPSQAKTTEENHTYNYDQTPKADWWARIIEIVAAVATCALAVIGYLGVRAALGTLTVIRKQTRSIHHQAVQVRKQTRLLRISAQAAQKTITLQYRPRLAVRSINVSNWMASEMFGEEPDVRVTFTIANIGGSPAKITDTSIIFSPIIPSGLWNDGENIGAFTLRAGQSESRTIYVDRSMNNVVRKKIARGVMIGEEVYCVGRIRFLDIDGTPRERGFIRKLISTRFVQLENPEPDYEYDD